MKTIAKLSQELMAEMSALTSYEETKVLVFVSYVLDNPYRDHRLETKRYSIRYKARDNFIHIYNGYNYTADDDIEYLDDIEITNDYLSKIDIRYTMSNKYAFIRKYYYKIKTMIRRWFFNA